MYPKKKKKKKRKNVFSVFNILAPKVSQDDFVFHVSPSSTKKKRGTRRRSKSQHKTSYKRSLRIIEKFDTQLELNTPTPFGNSSGSSFSNLSEDVKKTYFDFVLDGDETDIFSKLSLQHSRSRNSDFLSAIEKIPKRELKALSSVQLACYINDFNKLKEFIKEGRDLNRLNSYNRTCLHYAVESGGVSIFEYILKTCPEVELDIQDNEGFSPFMISCALGHSGIMKTLYERKINTFVINKKNQNPIDLIKNQGMLDEFTMLQKKGIIFFKLVVTRKFELAFRLLEQYRNVDFMSRDNQHFILEFLLKKPEGMKDNPKGIAKEMGRQLTLLKSFLKKGIDVPKKILSSKDDNVTSSVRKLLKNYYNKNMSKFIMIEFLKSEKIFYDDTLIIIDLFENFVKFAKENIKNKKFISIIKQLLNGIQIIHTINKKFVGSVMRIMENFLAFDETKKYVEVLNEFMTLKLDYYLFFTQNLRLFEGMVARFDIVKELKKYLTKKFIPKPKIQEFDTFIAKPRFRLVEYQNLLERLLKYVDEKNNEKLHKITSKALGFIKEKLQKMDLKTSDLLSSKKIEMLSMFLTQKYKYSLNDSRKRKFIFHVKNPKIICSFFKDIDVIGVEDKIITESDIIVFSDSIVIGIGYPNGVVKKYDFTKFKVCFMFHLYVVQIAVYEGNNYFNCNTFTLFINDVESFAFSSTLMKIEKPLFLINNTFGIEKNKVRDFLRYNPTPEDEEEEEEEGEAEDNEKKPEKFYL